MLTVFQYTIMNHIIHKENRYSQFVSEIGSKSGHNRFVDGVVSMSSGG